MCRYFVHDIQIDMHHTNRYGQTALHMACGCGNLEIFKSLYQHLLTVESSAKMRGILNQTDVDGDTLLHTACHTECESGNVEMVQYLVTIETIDLNKVNGNEQTPLMVACIEPKKEVVQVLLLANVDVNKANNEGQTALFTACRCDHREITQLLLTAGADINKADNEGQTVLLMVSQQSNEEMVKLLLEAGADVNIADNYGDTPFRWILDGHYADNDLINLALSTNKKLNVDNPNLSGEHLLYLAIRHEYFELAKLLLTKNVCLYMAMITNVSIHFV